MRTCRLSSACRLVRGGGGLKRDQPLLPERGAGILYWGKPVHSELRQAEDAGGAGKEVLSQSALHRLLCSHHGHHAKDHGTAKGAEGLGYNSLTIGVEAGTRNPCPSCIKGSDEGDHRGMQKAG